MVYFSIPLKLEISKSNEFSNWDIKSEQVILRTIWKIRTISKRRVKI